MRGRELSILGLLVCVCGVAGCATPAPAATDPFGPWLQINGASSFGCASGRRGWRLSVPGYREDENAEAFRHRVRSLPDDAIALSRRLLLENPDDERIPMLLWALVDEKSDEVVRLCWDVLTRLSWNETHDAGAFASLVLQLRMGHHSPDSDRNLIMAQLLPLAKSPEECANLGFLAHRQGCLERLPPEITAEFAQQALLCPDQFPLGMSIVAGGSGPPSGIGNLTIWRLFMLAGRASVPHLAQNLFADSRAVRAGAQWCLERIFLESLKDMGWDYSPDMTAAQLEKLRQDGIVGDLCRRAR